VAKFRGLIRALVLITPVIVMAGASCRRSRLADDSGEDAADLVATAPLSART